MLEYLKLENVGPTPQMEVQFAPRVNLITGDNGLGKSFLLDTAWWALTGSWPAEVNRRMTSGFPARPRDREKDASIRFRMDAAGRKRDNTLLYHPAEEVWDGRQGPTGNPTLVVYAHADGSFSVWDPVRNDWPRRRGQDFHDRRPPYVFTETEVWDGLKRSVDGRTVPASNGLLYDWSKGAALLRRAIGSVFIGVLACGRRRFGSFCRVQSPGISFGQRARP